MVLRCGIEWQMQGVWVGRGWDQILILSIMLMLMLFLVLPSLLLYAEAQLTTSHLKHFLNRVGMDLIYIRLDILMKQGQEGQVNEMVKHLLESRQVKTWQSMTKTR